MTWGLNGRVTRPAIPSRMKPLSPATCGASKPLVYRLWMGTHAEKKLIPILTHNDLGLTRRVLDVGCGPGTNAPHFSHTDYLGIDSNERYVRDARSRYSGRFQVGDAAKLQVPVDKRFDLFWLIAFCTTLTSRPRAVSFRICPLC
jgi:SAM-dependent methyltransferase